MIVIVAITVGLVLFASQAVADICTGRYNGDQLPNPSDCSSFYVCNYGEPKLFKCVNDLLYDPTKRVCNWAYMVTCGQLGTPDNPSSLPNPPYYNPSPYPEGQYPIPEYSTAAPQYTTIPTPYTGHPPPIIDIPNQPDYSETTEFYPGLVESIPNVFHCTNPEFYFAPHPRNCEKYFICENYRIHDHQCGEGIYWDYVFNQCDFPVKTFCYSGGISSPVHPIDESDHSDFTTEATTIGVTGPIAIADPIVPTAAPDTIICPGTQAFIAHPKDCHKYYICIGGIPIVTSCPDRMAWDERMAQCNEEAFSQCSG